MSLNRSGPSWQIPDIPISDDPEPLGNGGCTQALRFQLPNRLRFNCGRPALADAGSLALIDALELPLVPQGVAPEIFCALLSLRRSSILSARVMSWS